MKWILLKPEDQPGWMEWIQPRGPRSRQICRFRRHRLHFPYLAVIHGYPHSSLSLLLSPAMASLSSRPPPAATLSPEFLFFSWSNLRASHCVTF
ncbi:hypothetical protein ASPFODRAFT_626001 [Aspergillus luchuensis CBS 106.47]|uniref:Uncharacterized protein n=1 Tax=Aspergillus luchuensis (strain CBS 106.47) TaxID=1137211 RepID=A0A1M3TG28_ASPLC|nr:hypothetical protein ASPFODRAFT_626001 [Aspergillus luchuensis CBS 106.47]